MLKVWILIIVIGSDHSGRSSSVVQQEFSSIENCQTAMKSIGEQIKQSNPYVEIKSSGCYQK